MKRFFVMGLRASQPVSLFRSKIVAGLLALGLVLAPSVGFAQAYRFWWQVVDELGRPYYQQSVRCSVYRIGTGTALAYHFSSNFVNPGSTMPLLADANSAFHFWTDSTTDVGVLCNSFSGGQSGTRLRYTDHSIMIDRQGRKVVRFQATTNASPTNTNVFLNGGAVIRDVIVQNMAAGATHIGVGFRGSHLGTHNAVALVHELSLSTAGFLRPGAVIAQSGPSAIGNTQYAKSGGDLGMFWNVVGNHRGVALSYSHVVGTYGQQSGGRLLNNAAGLSGMYPSGFYMEVAYVVPEAGVELVYITSSGDVKAHVFVMFDAYHLGSMGTDYRF